MGDMEKPEIALTMGDAAGIRPDDQANIARTLLATRSGATLFMGLPVVCACTGGCVEQKS